MDGVEVNALGPGGFFGELAILGNRRRTATVTNTSPARLLCPLRDRVPATQQEHPELASRIEAGVRSRLQPAA
jgi:voltage-gated potassium channel